MKKLMVLLVFIMLVSGCGDSGGKKSSTTNPVGVNNGTNTTLPGRTTPGGSVVTPTTPGVTPYGHGENSIFPRGDIYLEFNKNASGQVYADGDLILAQQFGSLNCVLPAGTYDLTTSSPGQEKLVVHNYGGVSLSAVGPVSFIANLENSLSMQNQNGEWVMHASLKLVSVGGVACSYPMTFSFSMPLAY